MMTALPSRVALDVHEGATICPVLSDVPVPLLEQMQRAGCELIARDNGDVVVFTPHGGEGYTITSFFEHFPQLYQALDMESLEQYSPFLDEETAEILRSNAEEPSTRAGSMVMQQAEDTGSTRTSRRRSNPNSQRGSEREMQEEEESNARNGRRVQWDGELDAFEETFATMKSTLHNSLSKAEHAIDSHLREHREASGQLEAEREQIAEERARLTREREELAEKEERLQRELEELDRLRSELDTSARSGKKGFLWC
mmetsp:Transcript_181161/g.440825  ORF Transcript_181161/g.440825 Transcript_181161/m.440825 type:complete len:256 (+) Transcript_181161:237-1004(+)